VSYTGLLFDLFLCDFPHNQPVAASLASIATPFGCLLSGPLLDQWGRRVALLALNLPGLIGWILLATAKAGSGFLAQVYVGRLLTGLSLGMASVPPTVIKLMISILVNKAKAFCGTSACLVFEGRFVIQSVS
jgi:MFS family permease